MATQVATDAYRVRGGRRRVTVGVVGDGSLADRIREFAERDDADVVAESVDHASDESPDDAPDGVAGGAPDGSIDDALGESVADVLAADPRAVVAVGEPALLALVRQGVSAPVLPIAAGPGYGGVPESAAEAAVEELLAGEFETESRAVLGVSVGGERVGRALADAMLVTSEPARISEYAVRSRGELVAGFRADAVVVSTPAGSHGYARSAGGPLLEPGSGVVGVVPVAPFAVDVDHWVVSADEPVELTVERDEGEVSLLLDDRRARSVPPGTPVEAVADGAVDLARVSASRPFFER